MMTPKRNAVATVNALIIADLNAKLHYAEQHLAAALEFAHKLSLAKDFSGPRSNSGRVFSEPNAIAW